MLMTLRKWKNLYYYSCYLKDAINSTGTIHFCWEIQARLHIHIHTNICKFELEVTTAILFSISNSLTQIQSWVAEGKSALEIWVKAFLLCFNIYRPFQFSSVQFSRSVMSDSLWPHEPQHTRPPCPSPTHGVYPNPCPLSSWCHPAISSSVVPFSTCPLSFPASESFQMSQLVAWGGQSIGVSASTSVLPGNSQDWSPLGWTGWISLQSTDSLTRWTCFLQRICKGGREAWHAGKDGACHVGE